ncbi:acyltransferase family protein [Thalassotalea montiporae]
MEAKSKFRRDINGLRAIAVIVVILFHAEVHWLSGGFIGVDIFFVISGFLITTNIVKSLEDRSFSFSNFYSRRIKRLFPATFFTILATLAFATFILTPDQFVELAKSAIYASAFLANLWFANNSGYFDQAADISPLVHLWSLAVEEQYYLVIPVVYALSFKFGGISAIRRLTLAIFICSLSISIYFTALYANYSFYLLHTRMWELAIGAILALYPMRRALLPIIANTLALTGFSLIALGLLLITELSPYPGYHALIPTLGTALIILSMNQKNVIGFNILASKPFQFIGTISFSAYLWHWPVIVFYRIYRLEQPFTPFESFLLISASIVAGFLSWRFIEEKFRYSQLSFFKTLAATAGASAVTVACALIIYVQAGLTNRIPQEVVEFTDRNAMWYWQCKQQKKLKTSDHESYCVIGETWQDANTYGVIWGDSHSLHWAPSFDLLGRELGIAFIVAPLECPAYLNSDYVKEHYPTFPQFTEKCSEKHKSIVNWLNANAQVTEIVMAAAWTGHARMLYTDEIPENLHSHVPVISRNGQPGSDLSKMALINTIESLDTANKRILLLGDVARPNRNLNECAFNARDLLIRSNCAEPYTHLDREKINHWHQPTEEALAEVAEQLPMVTFISSVQQLCNDNECPTVFNNELIYKDTNHLRRNLSSETNLELIKKMGLKAYFAEDN